MLKNPAEYTLAEELTHAITHGAGVILSIAGLSWMLFLSIAAADPWRIVGQRHLWRQPDRAVPGLDALPRLAGVAAEASVQAAGSLRDLSADRGHLHAVCAGRDARWHRLVAVRRHLGAGHRGYPDQAVVAPSLSEAVVVQLSGDGLAGGDRRTAAVGSHRHRRDDLGRGRRASATRLARCSMRRPGCRTTTLSGMSLYSVVACAISSPSRCTCFRSRSRD